MEKVEIREFEEKKDEYQSLTMDEIKEKLNKLNISSIAVSGNELYKFEGGVLTILYNSYDNPIVLKKDGSDGNVLNINPGWYLENQEVADEIVRYICENINRDKFSIDTKVLIDDKLVDSLCKNRNLQIVSLAEFGDDGYYLSNEYYLKIKQSNIGRVETKGVEKELEENFDFLIGYNFSRRLISYYSYNDIMISDILYISEALT